MFFLLIFVKKLKCDFTKKLKTLQLLNTGNCFHISGVVYRSLYYERVRKLLLYIAVKVTVRSVVKKAETSLQMGMRSLSVSLELIKYIHSKSRGTTELTYAVCRPLSQQ